MEIEILKRFLAAPLFFIVGLLMYLLDKYLFTQILAEVNTSTWSPIIVWGAPLFPVFVLLLFVWWAFFHVSGGARRRRSPSAGGSRFYFD